MTAQSRRLLAVVFAIVTPAAAAAQAQQRELYVSVVDKQGVPVKDMQVADFVVREDKLAREVLAVRPFTDTLDIALLIDNTQAAQRETSILRRSLATFAREMGDGHRYALINFAERPTLVVDNVTSAEELITRGIDRLFPLSGSGSYLLDAILETSRGFIKREASRPVIVVVSFEGQELSNSNASNVIASLRQAGSSLFVVAVNTPSAEDFNTIERQSREAVYGRGAREAGGRLQTTLSSLGLEQELKELAAVLKQRYVVTYARPETLIPPDKVEVTSKRPSLDVRALPARSGGPK